MSFGIPVRNGLGVGLLASTSLSTRNTSAFSPATLFAASEPGGWYDPSDLTTLFQDSAGTTPVTAAGQSVGLWLDKSRGLVRGADVITNGNFATDTWWGKDSAWTISGGVATYAGATSNQIYTPASTLVTGLLYEVTFDVTAVTTAGSLPVISQTTLTLNVTTTGTYTAWVFASADGRLRFGSGSGSTWRGSIDNVVCRVIAGNHLSQSSSGQRAIYGVEPVGGRRNLLTYTEQFDNASWGKTRASITANATTSPDGTVNADKLVEDTTASESHFAQQVVTVVNATTYTWTVYAKAAERTWLCLYNSNVTQGKFFNLSNGTLGSDFVGAPGSAAITNAGNGWYRCSITFTTTGTTATLIHYLGSADGVAAYTGNGTSGLFLWGAQLETGSTATAYQRVVTAFDVTQAGVPSLSYIQFDGSDDSYVSPTITPGIDKAQVFAGVRKLSDAAEGMLLETSTTLSSGSLRMYAPRSAADNYAWRTGGSAQSEALAGGYPAPITNVLTGIGDIAADTSILRANGSQVATSATDQGTGNFLAYPLYVGRRAGSSLAYNGRVYSLIVRFGANLSASTITQTENWVAGKTGIYTLEQLSRLNAQTADGTLYSAYAASDAQSNNYLVNNTVLAADGTSYNVI